MVICGGVNDIDCDDEAAESGVWERDGETNGVVDIGVDTGGVVEVAVVDEERGVFGVFGVSGVCCCCD